MKTIKFPSNTSFTGRNGSFKASGIEIFNSGNLTIIPITSKGQPAKCDIVIHKDSLPEFLGSIETMFDIKAKIEPKYFLFGESACNAYSEGMESLQESIESGEGFQLYEYMGDVFDLLSQFQGWGDYVCLNHEEYETISNF